VSEQAARWRILWSFSQPHVPTILLGLLLGLLISGASLASPLIAKWVLDGLDDGSDIRMPILILLGMLVVGSLLALWQWILMGTLAEQIVLEARSGMVRRFIGARVGEITSRSAGELVTRVTSDTLLLREAASSAIVGLINGVIMLIGSLVLMGTLDLPLLGTTVISVIIIVVIFILLMPGIARAQQDAQEAVGRLGGTLESALRAIRTVKASRAEDRQADRVISDATISANHSIRSVRRTAVAWVVAFAGIQSAIVVILGYGAWRVSEGAMAVSSLIAFLLYAFGLLGPITEISQNLTTLQSGLAAAGRIREISDIQQETDTARPPRPSLPGPVMARPDVVLQFDRVTAAYGDSPEPAVNDVSFTIPHHGHVAIVGPSGAGKTTLFSLMLRFIERDAGDILINGTSYSTLSHRQIRGHFAYVEQETPIVPGTIRITSCSPTRELGKKRSGRHCARCSLRGKS
jgi:ATP-binding cassette subfamily B protein